MLLDTPSLYFRAYYGVPDSITAPDGTPVNAIRGLLDFMARLIRDYMPTRVVAAMDADWRPKWRGGGLSAHKPPPGAGGRRGQKPPGPGGGGAGAQKKTAGVRSSPHRVA